MAMVSLVLLLMIGAAVVPAGPSRSDGDVKSVNLAGAATRVAGCGFKSVHPKFDGDLQADVIEVLGVSSASAKQLRCVARTSLDLHYYVVFPAPLYPAYETLYERMSREHDKTDARLWLERRGLLSRLPTYDPKRYNEVAFAHTLETLCGPKAAGTLQPLRGISTFKNGVLGAFDKGVFTAGKLDEETKWCLFNAATVSGYPLGFIGNEAYPLKR